jgi:hypothetical protein
MTPYSLVDTYILSEFSGNLFYPEDGRRKFLRNAGTYLPDYTAAHVGGVRTYTIRLSIQGAGHLALLVPAFSLYAALSYSRISSTLLRGGSLPL